MQSGVKCIYQVFLPCLVVLLAGSGAMAQGAQGNPTYAFKIYHVNEGFYPVVQAYIRTWNEDRDPLLNVNIANIGLMVEGKIYDVKKDQYNIVSLRGRGEGFRTVLVLDCSKSMAGKPFADAQAAVMRFIDGKAPHDPVAIIAIRDTDSGYELISNFETESTPLYHRLMDVKCDGNRTRLYDSVAAALELCATATQGSGSAFPVLPSIVVLSDGRDEGSALSRNELITRIGQLSIPVPIFSLAYSNLSPEHFLNLEALSKASFGRYWTHKESQELTATVQKIQNINRSDFVVSFRAYPAPDGRSYPFKIGLRYPSDTGPYQFQSAEFESIQSPARLDPQLNQHWERISAQFPLLPGGPFVEFEQPASFPDPLPEPEEKSETNPFGSTLLPPVDPAPEPAEGRFQILQQTSWIWLGGMGAGLLIILLAIVLWVKRGGAAEESLNTPGHSPTTNPLSPSIRQGSDTGTTRASNHY